ncbi:MAG: NTP transferase domain-containing protein [Treponema sp.]|jgi:spore coat polysaccharide biosynthesis protein SpsF|nr:NTP transferase domain-containing protein [Treponema sp.]
MTAVVLQARMDSTRLPGKSLLPLGDKPMVSRVMEALRFIPADLYVLACPSSCAGVFEAPARDEGFVISPGPSADVLARYCIAIRRFGIKRVIRATADNPFVFADAAQALNAEAESLGASYAGYSGLPFGTGVESVDSGALLRAERDAVRPGEREHVCPYLYNHGEIFSLHRPLAPKPWREPSLRLSVDTRGDYERAVLLHEELLRRALPGEGRFNGAAVIAAARDLYAGNTGPDTRVVREFK